MTYFTALTHTCWENHEGNWSTTYFTALTQICWENHEPKESRSRGGENQGAVLNLDDHIG